MAFRKPKKNAKKVIDREGLVGRGTPGRTSTVIAHNFYEAGPSGVEFTDCVLEVELQDNPRPTKQVRLHSPPRAMTSTQSTIADRLSSLDGLVPSPFATNPLSFELQHHFPSPEILTGEYPSTSQTIPLDSIPTVTPTAPSEVPSTGEGHHGSHKPVNTNAEHGESKRKRASGITCFAMGSAH